jgi:hypothetical protein
MVSISISGMTGWVNPFFLAARRPWTTYVSRRRSADAFFYALVARFTSQLVARFRACRSVSPGSRGQPTPASQSHAGRTMRDPPWQRGIRGCAWWRWVVPMRAWCLGLVGGALLHPGSPTMPRGAGDVPHAQPVQNEYATNTSHPCFCMASALRMRYASKPRYPLRVAT